MLSLYDVAKAAITLFLILAFLWFGLGLKGVIFGYVLAAAIGGTAKNLMAFHVILKTMWAVRREVRFSTLKGRLKEIIKFLINTNVGSTLGIVVKNIDVMMLGYFRTPVEVGYFKLAKSFVSYLPRLSDPFYVAVYPQLSKLWAEGKRSQIIQLLKKVTAIMASIALPVALIMFIFATQIVSLTAGQDFIPAVVAIRIMIVGIVVAVLLFWTHPAYLAMGRADAHVKVNAVSSALLIVLTFLLVPTLGFIGSAINFVIPYLFGHAIAIRIIIKSFKKEEMEVSQMVFREENSKREDIRA